MARPRIAVTTSNRSGWRIFPLVALNVRGGGGRAVRWGAGRPSRLADVDGLIIGGGDDISPELYGGALHLSVRIDANRDALELRLAQEALDMGIPILGICRGAQMINVAAGGSLDQDAYRTHGHSTHYRTILPRKTIHPLPGSGLAGIAGAQDMRVNALHSQAVDRVGAGLQVAARDDGGMIQAVEAAGRFVLGVQWHPEHLFYARRQRALFKALVDAAR
ncbi:MAG: gamma-glutamyl-gamma-aminobutyrate hydrolase family protein [Alphaproteobacteria bacterium]|jgi:putative glutamine amidotransferase|nr:gamma-glutamyl-gamma-aminobutyrate hydrolase family protein [Alphaproteobacteria bacterium]